MKEERRTQEGNKMRIREKHNIEKIKASLNKSIMKSQNQMQQKPD